MSVVNAIDPAWAIIAVVPLMTRVFGLICRHGKPRVKQLRFRVRRVVFTLVATQRVASAIPGS